MGRPRSLSAAISIKKGLRIRICLGLTSQMRGGCFQKPLRTWGAGQGQKGEMKTGKDLFLNSNPVGGLQAEDGVHKSRLIPQARSRIEVTLVPEMRDQRRSKGPLMRKEG